MSPVSFFLFPLRKEKRGTQPPRVSNRTGEKRAEPAEPLPFPKPFTALKIVTNQTKFSEKSWLKTCV